MSNDPRGPGASASREPRGPLLIPTRWGRIAIGILLLALIGNVAFAFLTSGRGTLAAFRLAYPGYLALAVALALVPQLTNALRMLVWARFLGGRLAWREAFRIAVASDLGAAVTPTVAGSGGVRLIMLRGHGLSTGRASALLAVTALEDAVFFAVCLPLGYALSSRALVSVMPGALARVMGRAGLVLAGAVLVGVVVSALGRRFAGRASREPGSRVSAFTEHARSWVREGRGALGDVLRRGKLRAACTFTLAAIQWLCRYSAAAAILAAFGLPAFPLAHVVLQWVVFTAGTFIPTPGGAAAVETAFAVVYHPLVPDALLGPVTAIWRFVVFYLLIAFDVAFLALFAVSRKPTSATAEKMVSSAPAA